MKSVLLPVVAVTSLKRFVKTSCPQLDSLLVPPQSSLVGVDVVYCKHNDRSQGRIVGLGTFEVNGLFRYMKATFKS